MKIKVYFLIIFTCFFLTACAPIKSGVHPDNTYYSDITAIKIKIDPKFVYSPQHPIAKLKNFEFFISDQTKEHIYIKVIRGEFAPENSFKNHKMISIDQVKILNKTLYIGVFIHVEASGFYLKRVYLYYPNNYTLLEMVHTKPLSLYGNEHYWSDEKNLTEKQKEIIKQFVEDSEKYIKFIE